MDATLRRMIEIATELKATMEFPSSGSTFLQSSTAIAAAVVNTDTTASQVYVDLAHAGPAVTIVAGPSGIAIVSFSAGMSATGAQPVMSVALSGGNVVAAADNVAIFGLNTPGLTLTNVAIFTGLSSAAATTFTCKYRVTGAVTGTFNQRSISVLTY